MEADVVLGPRCLGQNMLYRWLAYAQLGKVAWMQGERNLELLLVSGRPQMAEDSTGQLYDEVEGVKQVSRLAVATTGTCRLQKCHWHRSRMGEVAD